MCFAIASEFQNSEQKGGLQIKKCGVIWRLHKCRGRLQKKKSGVIRRLHNFPLSWFFECLTMPRRSIVRRSLRPFVMPPMYVPPQEVHCPVKSPTRGTCKVCGKRTCLVCKGCGVHLHVKNCFLAHHGLV